MTDSARRTPRAAPFPFRSALVLALAVIALLQLGRWMRPEPPAIVALNGVAVPDGPIRLGASDVLSILPAVRGARVRYLVEFQLEGAVILGEVGSEGATTGLRVQSSPAARAAPGRRVRSSFVAVDSLPRFVLRSSTGPAILSDVRVRVLRRTPSVPWSPLRAAIVSGILAAGTVALWVVQASRAGRELAILGMATGILAVLTPVFALVVLVLLACLFQLGRLMHRHRDRRKPLLWTAIAAILVVCSGWKYAQPLFGAFFQTSLGALAAPMGAGFFVLRLVDAQLRWYRDQESDLSFREYLTYALFPATLVAGPMQMLTGFRERRLAHITRQDVAAGAGRMVIGLAKKLIIGDFILYGLLYGKHFALFDRAVLVGGGATTATMLLVAFLFAAIDISAYADLAIGLARMHGYRIREDSNWPVLASSLGDFWRRWHMSVMEWCMTNIYVGVLLGTRSAFVALLLSMMAMGAWHQLTWPWMLWAVHFTLALTLERWVSRQIRPTHARLEQATRVATRVFALCVVVSAHAFAQTDDVGTAMQLYRDFWLAPWR